MSFTSWIKIPLFRLRLFVGFVFLIIYQTLDSSLTSLLENLFRSSQGAPNWVWLVALLSVILNMLAPLFISFWILTGSRALKSWQQFELMIIESLRAWGSTFLWTLFLILPGFYRWLSLSTVPMVVLFSKKYHLGQVDALHQSQQIFHKRWGKIFIFAICFYFLVPLVMASILDGYRKIWITPFLSLGASLLDYMVLLVSLFLLLNIFKRALAEVNDELVF